MDYHILKPECIGMVGVLTISRPESLNALNSEFFKEMLHYLDIIVADEPCRVLIITGAGKAFVAGADISEMVHLDPDGAKRFSEKGQQIFLMIENLPIPVIAAVNGYALGGGCELAMACDIRLASQKALFGQPEVNLGLIPGYAGTQRLPKLVGVGNAMKMILTGQNIDAQEAWRIGLVQGISEPDKLMEDAMALATQIASRGPSAIRYAKRAIRKGLILSMDKGMDTEKDYFSRLFLDEGIEGMNAFLEKRKPEWK